MADDFHIDSRLNKLPISNTPALVSFMFNELTSRMLLLAVATALDFDTTTHLEFQNI